VGGCVDNNYNRSRSALLIRLLTSAPELQWRPVIGGQHQAVKGWLSLASVYLPAYLSHTNQVGSTVLCCSQQN